MQILIKQQQLIEDAHNHATFLADGNGRCTYANSVYQAMVGLELEDLMGEGWKNVLADSSFAEAMAQWESCVRDGRDFHRSMRFVNRRLDREFPVHVSAYVVADDGKPIAWIGHVRPSATRIDFPDGI
jgi:PAS domain S-box-containing protein